MRLLTTSLLAMTLFSSAFASDYYCKSSYDAKLERIEANRTVRMIGQGTLGLGLIVSGVAVPMIIYGGGAAGISIISALVTGPTAQWLMEIVDREDGLLMAKKFIELSQLNRDDLKASSYEDFIDEKLKKRNRGSDIEVTREQVYSAYPFSEFQMNSIVDLALERVNKKRQSRSLEKLSYEGFQAEVDLMLKTDLFCQNRAQTYRKVVKLMKNKLKH